MLQFLEQAGKKRITQVSCGSFLGSKRSLISDHLNISTIKYSPSLTEGCDSHGVFPPFALHAFIGSEGAWNPRDCCRAGTDRHTKHAGCFKNTGPLGVIDVW